MPYPMEHSARLVSPTGFIRYRRQNDKFGKGIHAIFGIRSDQSTVLQAIRFDKTKFTVAQAKSWLKKNKFKPIKFEPATGKKAANMKKIEFSFDADIIKSYHKVKEDDDSKFKKGNWIIEGYVMTSDIDAQRTLITPAAIKGAKNDLLKYSTVLFNHNVDNPIGKILETDFDDKGLWVKMKLSKSEIDIWKKVKEGIISKFSIKGRVLKESIKEVKDTKTKPKKESDSDADPSDQSIRKITRLELYEASLVSVPANVEARTINWYVSKALEPRKMKKIQKNSETKVKKVELVQKKQYTYLEKKELVKKLKALVGKSKNEEDKEIIRQSIAILKKTYGYYYEKKEKILGLSDKSENIYEINNTDTIDLDGNKFRKQILKTGRWYHWDAEGGVLKINKDAIGTIVKNFKDNIVEHVYVPLTHTPDPVKNAGEVLDLIPTEDGLDAVCEIKDENVSEKIKDGLIKCVSASIEENYMKKDTGEYVGPTLLHAALVAEPYIKGMSGFAELSEESKDKKIISLSDTEPTIADLMGFFRKDLAKFEKQMTNLKLAIKADLFQKSAYTDCIGREMKAGKSMAEAAKICKKEADVQKLAYTDCMKKEIKASKSMKEASKICKKEATKEIEVKKSVKKIIKKDKKVKSLEEKKVKSESHSKAVVDRKGVDLAEAERVYRDYLEQGKVIPAQKDVLISLLTSKSEINLGDEQVGIKKILTLFLENQPKIVDFEEKGTQKIDKTKKAEKKEIPGDAKQFYGKMGLNKKQTREAWEFAQENAKKAEGDKSTLF